MKDEAIAILDKDISKREIIPCIHYQDLLNNPFFDNLGDEPRFEEIVNVSISTLIPLLHFSSRIVNLIFSLLFNRIRRIYYEKSV